MAEPVVEWAPFRLKAGVTPAVLLDASDAIQRNFLAPAPGFLRRELVADGSRYVDIVWWRDRASLDQAMAAVAASPACSAYFALMDMNADGAAAMEIFATVKRY